MPLKTRKLINDLGMFYTEINNSLKKGIISFELHQKKNTFVTQIIRCGCGEIGRHARLRI
tara:strand:- start:1 stop:180 length:180 start_codon:yes stop_codon:yes gene_type:complete